jgi:hypothetical protein
MDPVQRIALILTEQEKLDAALTEALFEARLQGRFEEARLAAGLARKPALARTRKANEALGRQVRWGLN